MRGKAFGAGERDQKLGKVRIRVTAAALLDQMERNHVTKADFNANQCMVAVLMKRPRSRNELFT